MKKILFRLPAEVTIEVADDAVDNPDKLREAVKKKVQNYQHPLRWERSIMAAFTRRKFTVE